MVNKLTHGSNMFWESSRMILPEHKSRMIQHRQELKRQGRIELDESEWESISQAVAESMELKTPISLKMYDPFEDLTVTGIVERVDQMKGRFMVDGSWFKIQDIEGMTTAY